MSEARIIETHIVEGSQTEHLKLVAVGERGPGNANHAYVTYGFKRDTNYSYSDVYEFIRNLDRPNQFDTFVFQNGTIPENGLNGITNEVLLAIVADRLEGFQRSEFANEFNANALNHCTKALHCLQLRTANRMRRGVEGTHQK